MRAIQAAGRALHTVKPGATLHDVAQLMASEGLRAVVVEQDDGYPAGIVTERDLVVRGLARQLPPSTRVDAVMTPDPVTADAFGPRAVAYRILRDFGIRQVPLMDDSRVVAVLERDDLADEMTTELLAGWPACPQCQGHWLSSVTTVEEDTNFLCLLCRSCWHVQDGRLVRVDERTCPGCPDHNFCRVPAIDHGADMVRFPKPGESRR
jgi:CBS domain-containing protein